MTPTPEPDDWLAYGFRSPEATFLSFQTALAGDRADLEYLCISAAFKKREAASLFAYEIFRRELFDDMPWLRQMTRADVERVEDVRPGRKRLHARVDWLLWNEPFYVDLVHEDFFEYWSDDERIYDDFWSLNELEFRERGLRVQLPWPDEVEADDVTEVRAGREWKIDGFGQLETTDEP